MAPGPVPPFICKSWHFTHRWKALVMTASFHEDGMFGPIKLLFMWPLTKPEKSEVMYLCLKFIDSVSFYIVFFIYFLVGMGLSSNYFLFSMTLFITYMIYILELSRMKQMKKY